MLSLTFAAGATALLTTGFAKADTFKVSGPYTFENLAIYFVHGERHRGEAPLTLQEALKAELAQVHETGDVDQLEIENHGEEEIFVQAGDIVRGGKQDRVLTSSLLVPPRSGRLPVASYCVEEGRWAQRVGEDAARFSSADALLPSKDAKITIRSAGPVQLAGIAAGANVDGATPPSRQRDIWRSVAATQDYLTRSLGRSVKGTVSPTSLLLSLETPALKERQGQYTKALERLPQDETIVGYAFAVNGRLNSAEIYSTQALFGKLWPKLLRASATEAIAESGRLRDAVPSAEAVEAFLKDAEGATARTRSLTADVKVGLRETELALFFETQRAQGGWINRSYLAK
jgi:hypothetical protein